MTDQKAQNVETEQSVHVPVLLAECLDVLKAGAGGVFCDCTLGGGGHTRAILDAHPANQVFALDRDLSAVQRAQRWSDAYGDRLQVFHSAFADAGEIFAGQKFDGILADLGFSSDQLLSGRGFSFLQDEPLDMRMDLTQGSSAAEILNSVSKSDLAKILKEGGLQNEARIIADVLVRERENKRISTTKELASIIVNLRLKRLIEKDIHPATLVFQALRIAVNQELKQIKTFLQFVPQCVKPSARLAIISFHSLEDQLVTKTLRSWQRGPDRPASWAGTVVNDEIPVRGTLLSREAIVASEAERQSNPRSRSAKLRVFEFN